MELPGSVLSPQSLLWKDREGGTESQAAPPVSVLTAPCLQALELAAWSLHAPMLAAPRLQAPLLTAASLQDPVLTAQSLQFLKPLTMPEGTPHS